MMVASRQNELEDEITVLMGHKQDLELRINSNNLMISQMEGEILVRKKEQKSLSKAQ